MLVEILIIFVGFIVGMMARSDIEYYIFYILTAYGSGKIAWDLSSALDRALLRSAKHDEEERLRKMGIDRWVPASEYRQVIKDKNQHRRRKRKKVEDDLDREYKQYEDLDYNENRGDDDLDEERDEDELTEESYDLSGDVM